MCRSSNCCRLSLPCRLVRYTVTVCDTVGALVIALQGPLAAARIKDFAATTSLPKKTNVLGISDVAFSATLHVEKSKCVAMPPEPVRPRK